MPKHCAKFHWDISSGWGGDREHTSDGTSNIIYRINSEEGWIPEGCSRECKIFIYYYILITHNWRKVHSEYYLFFNTDSILYLYAMLCIHALHCYLRGKEVISLAFLFHFNKWIIWLIFWKATRMHLEELFVQFFLYLEKRPNVFFGHKKEYTNLPSTWKLCAQHCKSRLIGVDQKKSWLKKLIWCQLKM